MDKYDFCKLEKRVKERISKLDYSEDYSFDSKVSEFAYLTVLFRDKVVVNFIFQVTNEIIENSRRVSGSITVKRRKKPEWFFESINTIHINEFFLCGNGSYEKPLSEVLDDYFPLKDSCKIKIIMSVLGNRISVDPVKFDSFNKRYIISLNLNSFLNLHDEVDANDFFVYKYMSLDTYHKMLVNSSFRMNSIVSMNDSTESFFINDYVYGAQKSDDDFNVELVKNKNTLISSFSNMKDDLNMWRLYGDKGRGICLGFSVKKNEVKKIIYVDENNEKYKLLKQIANELKDRGIRFSYDEIEKNRCYVKKALFNIENEYRLLREVADENSLKTTLYGDLLSYYKDYDYDKSRKKFGGIEISPVSLIIGDNLPNKDVNFPLLVALSHEKFGIVDITQSSVCCFRD